MTDSLLTKSRVSIDRLRDFILEVTGGPQSTQSITATGTSQSRLLADIAADYYVINQDVSGFDFTGATDMSAKIKEAHDYAKAGGFRYCYVPRGDLLAEDLENGIADVIFVGPGRFIGSYRCHVIPEHARPFVYQNGVNPRQHLKRFLQAVDAGSAVIVLVGDSTTQGLDLEWLIRRKLRATFGAAADDIALYNLGLGGTAWDDYNAADFAGTGLSEAPDWWTNLAASWPSHVAALNPDLIFFNFGQNGTGDNIPFFLDATDFYGSLNTTAGLCDSMFGPRFSLPPDWIFQTPYCPTNMKPTAYTRVNQGRRLGAAGLARSFARSGCSGLTVSRPNGAGLIDIGRMASALRDGRDPCNTTLLRYTPYDDLDITLPFVFPVATEAFKAIWSVANMKTAYFDHGGLWISLSDQEGNGVLIERDDDTHAAVTVYAQTGVVARPRTLVPHNTTTGGGNLNAWLKDNWLHVHLGSTVFIDDYVVRFGDEYVPVIRAVDSFTSTSTVAQLLTTEHVLYQRSMTDDDQFGPGPDDLAPGENYPDPDGSGGSNHMRTRGSEMVLKPVIEATQFA